MLVENVRKNQMSNKAPLRTIKVSGVRSRVVELQSPDELDDVVTLSYTSYNAMIDRITTLEQLTEYHALKLNALEQYILTHQTTYEIRTSGGELFQYSSPQNSPS
jgi:hypothetical protein